MTGNNTITNDDPASSSSSTDMASSVRANGSSDDRSSSSASDEQNSESSPPLPIASRHRFTYTVDVLSDGSEHSGPSSLFLSVYRRRRCLVGVAAVKSSLDDNNVDDLDDTYLQARYAISGLGDLVSRTATDQRYKLHPVRAIFCTDSSSKLDLQGLPSILTVLHQAGKPELTVVSALEDVESVVESFHGKYKQYPVVRICQVPAATATCTNSQGDKLQEVLPVWWKVYEDELLTVHASRATRNVVYLYTMKQSLSGTETVLLLPAASLWTGVERWTSNLPVLTLLPGNQQQMLQVTTGIVFQHPGVSAYQVEENGSFSCVKQQLSHQLSSALKSSEIMWWYVVSPSLYSRGLLVRAQQQSRAWTSALPTYFPWRHNDEKQQQEEPPNRLVTGSTLRIEETTARQIVLDRLAELRRLDVSDERKQWPMVLKDFLIPRQPSKDSNEIDLEDAVDKVKDGDDLANNQAQLLVLGTGCASPSPHRGASAYALVFPNDDRAVAIEVGEGFVTQWHRHAGGRSLCTIAFIWISHAHWDHFGGLINLLVCHKREREKYQRSDNAQKRLKTTPPILVAPQKVLCFLRAVLGLTKIRDYTDRYYDHTGMPPDLLPSIMSNMVFWKNVRVDHNCHQAYGCIFGYSQQHGRQLRVLCFSGDTRPCSRLVHACRSVLNSYGIPNIHFLWHEATFDEAEQSMSLRKKHSTVQEALSIARQIRAERTLLTHFSQRYDTRIPQDSSVSIGYALDGMLIPLW